MTRLLAIFAIGLGLGGGVGFLVAASNSVTLDGHDHGARGHEVAAGAEQALHHEALVEVSGAIEPALSINVTEDPVSGWNLHAITENFRFAPENAGGTHVANEGHAHVYVDGIKIARLYGPWMHFGSLPENALVVVTLNSNDHRTYSIDGEAITTEFSLSAAH